MNTTKLRISVKEMVVDNLADMIGRDATMPDDLIDLIASEARREFLIELKQRAREDGFEIFSNYNVIPLPNSDDRVDVDFWFDDLLKEEG